MGTSSQTSSSQPLYCKWGQALNLSDVNGILSPTCRASWNLMEVLLGENFQRY